MGVGLLFHVFVLIRLGAGAVCHVGCICNFKISDLFGVCALLFLVFSNFLLREFVSCLSLSCAVASTGSCI